MVGCGRWAGGRGGRSGARRAGMGGGRRWAEGRVGGPNHHICARDGGRGDARPASRAPAPTPPQDFQACLGLLAAVHERELMMAGGERRGPHAGEGAGAHDPAEAAGKRKERPAAKPGAEGAPSPPHDSVGLGLAGIVAATLGRVSLQARASRSFLCGMSRGPSISAVEWVAKRQTSRRPCV